MEEILNELIDQYRDEIIDKTREMIEYPSLYGESEEGAPFGRPIEDALEKVLEIGETMGFETRNHEGYAGTIQWGNKGKQIGILTHVDVVPPGEGWSYPPFRGTVEKGRIYGRGALDDKGPMIAVLYAMKAVKESGLPVLNHVRHIIGTDEESGFMRCLKYYLQKEEAPWGGFSPDAEFPVIHAEKGILRFNVSSRWQEEKGRARLCLKKVWGGTKVNVVPGSAYAIIEGDDQTEQILSDGLTEYEDKNSIVIERKGTEWKIEAKGRSSHSSQPWNGKNAINILLNYLQSLPLEHNGVWEFAMKITEMFADGYRGENLGVACEDKLSGILTLSLGVLSIEETEGKASVEIRYPIHASDEVIQKTLRVACESNAVNL